MRAKFSTINDCISQSNKTKGLGIIVSLLMSWEFQFHFNLTKDKMKYVLEILNLKSWGTKYINKSVELAVYNKKLKTELSKNPFYCDFDYSKLKDEY